MIEQLTMINKKPVWVNLDYLVRMEEMEVEKGYPATRLVLMGGDTVEVYESPQEIAVLANFGGEDDGMDDTIPLDQ